eukprot:scaffold52127_cov59-Phaeocystis_antarctica.AAC.1
MALGGARCPLGRGGHLLAPHVDFTSPAPGYHPPLAQRASHLREGRADGAGLLRAGLGGTGKAKRGGNLMEPSVQVTKRAAKGATAWL